jgi:hypothetical protein
MSEPDRDSFELLKALGELERRERDELAEFDAHARELAATEPEHERQLEDRVLRSLEQPRLERQSNRLGSHLRWAGGSALALAAAALLVFVTREPATSPAFALIPPASDARTRSSSEPPAAGAVFHLNRRLQFTLRPATRYTGALQLDCAAHQGSLTVPFSPAIDVDAAGSRTLTVTTGRGGQLDVAPGDWELRCYLTPGEVSDAKSRSSACDDPRQCVKLAVTFLPAVEK